MIQNMYTIHNKHKKYFDTILIKFTNMMNILHNGYFTYPLKNTLTQADLEKLVLRKSSYIICLQMPLALSFCTGNIMDIQTFLSVTKVLNTFWGSLH